MRILLLSLTTLLLTSCYTTRVYVGDMDKNSPRIEVNSKINNNFISGLVSTDPGNKAEVLTNNAPGYMIETQHTFVNQLVGIVTFGIYCPTTTRFYVPYKNASDEQKSKQFNEQKKQRSFDGIYN